MDRSFSTSRQSFVNKVGGKIMNNYFNISDVEQHIKVLNPECYDSRSILVKYVCKYCGKALPSNSALKLHILTHTGEKPFVCEFCGRRFNHKQNFHLHKTLHTGRKFYKCEICGHEFNRKDRLAAHCLKHKRT